jgi:molybdopterin-guanine dinucleotide biosynthesis protein MobB
VRGVETVMTGLIPDEISQIATTLADWADGGAFDLILTTGGTGVSPRDVTPEATRQILDREIPGFGEMMRAESMKKTAHAVISRAVAGVRSTSLIINLPGSPKGAVENLEAVWPAVPHAVAKLQGDPHDCAAAVPAPTKTPYVVSFIARSGTGKTTLIEQIIARLKERGWKVGAIKHDACCFEIDYPGKDSYRLTAAGADTMVICSPEKLALVKRHIETPSVHELLSTYFSAMDVVVTEGFKQSDLPKIEVHRAALSDTLLYRGVKHDPTLIAVVSDTVWELDVPCLDLDNPGAVTDFIESRLTRSDG